jgi:hypothetical protein
MMRGGTMTKADLKRLNTAMVTLLIGLCQRSDRVWKGYRSAECEKDYQAARRLIRRAGREYKPEAK